MWKFYDAFTQRSEGYQPKEGPMPRKRWVRDGKRHKMSYRAPKQIGRGPLPSDRDMERKAAKYARWLAKRDGKTLPDGGATLIWAGFDVLTATGKRRWEKRIRAVTFGKVTIDLPNWDFVPEPMAKLAPLKEAA